MVAKHKIGTFGGKSVEETVLKSTTGVEVALINWGVIVRDWRVPIKGKPRSVVLGFDTFEPYLEHSPYFGALVGRVANRIKNSRFTVDGKTYTLPPTEGPNHLHGGPEGIGRQVWDMDVDSAANRVKFTYASPDGAMGYPGNDQIRSGLYAHGQPVAPRNEGHAGQTNPDQPGAAPVFQSGRNGHCA